MKHINRKKKLKKKIYRKIGIALLFFSLAGVTFFTLSRTFPRLFITSSYISPLPIELSEKVKLQSFLQTKSTDILAMQLSKNNIAYSTLGESTDASYIATLKNGEEIVFSPKKDLTAQVSSLQYILTRLTIEGKEFKLLDFRFDKPVIVFK